MKLFFFFKCTLGISGRSKNSFAKGL